MSYLTRFTKKYSQNQHILGVLLILFILFRINLPYGVSQFVGSLPGMIVIVVVVIYLFIKEGAVLGMLGLIAGYQILSSAGFLVNNKIDFLNEPRIPTYNNVQTVLPNKVVNGITFSPVNQFPPTLEQDVISNLVPMVKNSDPPHLKYKPSLERQHNAAPLGFTGVV